MNDSIETKLQPLLEKALSFRITSLDQDHQSALRLFNGFYEGCPDLVVDIYGSTIVLFSYCTNEINSLNLLQIARDFYLEKIPWINCVVAKHRCLDSVEKRGIVNFGSHPQTMIDENGVKYVIDLTMNQDASFYLDTRSLREWLLQNSKNKSLLNTFAYTGSLGIAALAGGADKVMQMDLSSKFLELSRKSAMLNRLDLGKMKLTAVDFFVGIGQLKKKFELFDIVIVDPPFFSTTEHGRVDQISDSERLINKVRPLVKDGGCIVTINNALFLSGNDYLERLEALGRDGFLTVEKMIPIPKDITGFPETIVTPPPCDPSPFNHPTKIVLLRVKRKS